MASSKRRESRAVSVGNVRIGGGAPISVQSMTNTDTTDIPATIAQLHALEKAGCDIVRLSAPTVEAAQIFRAAKAEGIRMPLVADIHFDYQIALACAEAGADKIRINPGNIGAEWKVREVAHACRDKGIPIRIGVNGGSLAKPLLQKYGSPCAEALVESAFDHAEMLQKYGFSDLVISIKSSTVARTIEANRLLASSCTYPIHLGVTEAGGIHMGAIKNAIGIGSLLADGIGDTIRVSMTADPVREVEEGRCILNALGLNSRGAINLISCPTCARTKIPLIALSEELERACAAIDPAGKTITVALMGCAVNGPGEAREADIGAAGGNGEALLFSHGETIGKVPESEIVPALLARIQELLTAET